jgi:hypothetical protein
VCRAHARRQLDAGAARDRFAPKASVRCREPCCAASWDGVVSVSTTETSRIAKEQPPQGIDHGPPQPSPPGWLQKWPIAKTRAPVFARSPSQTGAGLPSPRALAHCRLASVTIVSGEVLGGGCAGAERDGLQCVVAGELSRSGSLCPRARRGRAPGDIATVVSAVPQPRASGVVRWRTVWGPGPEPFTVRAPQASRWRRRGGGTAGRAVRSRPASSAHRRQRR